MTAHNIIAHKVCVQEENIMKTKSVMTCVGAAMAVGSAVAMTMANKSTPTTKKALKKTVGKVANFVDSIATMM